MVSPFLHLSRFPIHLSPLFPRSKYWPYPSRETPCPILPLVRLAPLAKVIVSRGWLTTPPDAVSKEIVSCWMLSVGSQGLEEKKHQSKPCSYCDDEYRGEKGCNDWLIKIIRRKGIGLCNIMIHQLKKFHTKLSKLNGIWGDGKSINNQYMYCDNVNFLK